MPRDAAVTSNKILAAAFGLVDREGADALSMRRLADALGVQAPSLYHHASGKPAILTMIADDIATRATAGLTTDLDWRELLERFARQTYAALRVHPGAAPIIARTEVSPALAAKLQPLFVTPAAELGVTPEEFALLGQSIYVLAVGIAQAEFGDLPTPPAAPPAYYDAWLNLSLTTFLDGLAQRALLQR